MSRAFVLKQLTSELKIWSGRMLWRRRNIVLPTSNVLTVTKAAASSCTTVPNARAHVESDGTFSAGFNAYAGANARYSQFHPQLIELDDCLSESQNCDQMLTKVAE